VPVLYGAIKARFKRGVELVILRYTVQLVPPILIAKPRQPCGIGV